MTSRLIAACAALAVLVCFAPAMAAEGNPISGVGVSVETDPGGIIASSGKTDAKGLLVVKELAAGTYKVTFLHAAPKPKTGAMNEHAPVIFVVGNNYASSKSNTAGLAVSNTTGKDGVTLDAVITAAPGTPLSATLTLTKTQTLTIKVTRPSEASTPRTKTTPPSGT
jgi:hypothetical protein